MQKKLPYFSSVLDYYISISVVSSDLQAIELIVKEEAWGMDPHATLQAAQREKEKDPCGFCVPGINIF